MITETRNRVKVNFVVLMSGCKTVMVHVDGMTDNEAEKLRTVVDNRVRRFVEKVNREDCKTI